MLYEELNVSIMELASTDPATWELIVGKCTIASLQPSHGRGVVHARKRNGIGVDTAWCSKKRPQLEGGHKDPNCIVCAAILAKRGYAMFYQNNV